MESLCNFNIFSVRDKHTGNDYVNILHGNMALQWTSQENAVRTQTGFIWLMLGTTGDIILGSINLL
jgi:hypothetical protein